MAKKDFLKIADWSAQEQKKLFEHMVWMKENQEPKEPKHWDKTLLLFFEKHSTRTRLSFQAAAHQLGAKTIFLEPGSSQVARGEPIGDTAAMFGLFADAIAIRTFEHERLEEFASLSEAPVINALTDLYHPCQILADTLTLHEEFGDVPNRTIAYVGDGNNITHSLAWGAAAFGYALRVVTPKGYEADTRILDDARAAGANIEVSTDSYNAVAGVDAIYTDTWVSMGQEEEKAQRIKDFSGFQVDQAMMDRAGAESIFLHCLPAYRGLEVSADVIDGPQSRIFPEAENRLHAQKALLDLLLD